MAIKTTEERKKQTTLLILALIILIAAAAVFYFGFLSKRKNVSIPESYVPVTPGQQAVPQPQIPSAVLDSRLKKITLNVDFFIKTILPFLKTHGDLPVKKGEVGRDNPFSAQ